jgi:MarR family transcriptional regulator for hemolysin
MPDEVKTDSTGPSPPSTNGAESDSALPAACESAGLPGPGHLPIDAPERRRLPPLLRRCWFNLNQTFRRRIAHIGVTPDQFTVMRTLVEGDPKGLTQRELTDFMSSDPNTMASLLERMEDGGVIERKQHENDRRAYRIRLKPTGRRKYEEVREIAVALQTEILAVLPAEKREEFLEHLALVAESCRVAAGNPLAKSGKS